MSVDRTLQDVQRERDLYRMLLDAERSPDASETLRTVLAYAVDVAGAARGYVALYSSKRAREATPLWSCGHACTPEHVQDMHTLVSSTIIDDTLRTQRITAIPSALGHPRYLDASSVRGNKITSVLCAPLGSQGRGVLYLQDRVRGGVFSAAHEESVGRLADLLLPLVDRLLRHHEEVGVAADATTRWRTDGAFASVVGSSRALATVFEALSARRHDDAPVWLTGPVGVGKALLARELHRMGARGRAWAEVSTRDEPGVDSASGVMRLPDHGTLLVRHIERLKFEDQRTLRKWADDDGRRLLATSRDDDSLAPDIREWLEPGRVRVPAWPERTEDVSALFTHFGHIAADRMGMAWPDIDASARLDVLELLVIAGPDAVMRRLATAMLDANGRPIRTHNLTAGRTSGRLALWDLFSDEPLRSWRDAKHTFLKHYLDHALRRHGDDAEATAVALGMSRSGLYTALSQLGRPDAETHATARLAADDRVAATPRRSRDEDRSRS